VPFQTLCAVQNSPEREQSEEKSFFGVGIGTALRCDELGLRHPRIRWESVVLSKTVRAFVRLGDLCDLYDFCDLYFPEWQRKGKGQRRKQR
jgi:hypothetical protein